MSEPTDREQPADDQDIEIVSLSDRPVDTQFIAPVSSPARPSLAPRFTPRQRRLQLIVTISVIMLALLIIFSSSAAVRGLIIRQPAPTPTLAPDVNLFYIQLEPAWGKVTVDGRALAHVPVIGKYPPLQLAGGWHMLQWIAAPFVTQRCTIFVPTAPDKDTCVDNGSVPIGAGRLVTTITFAASLNNLSPDQRAALTSATQALLDSQQRSTALVRPGEYYALPGSCRQGQPLYYQPGSCLVTAKQALYATLGFQLDTDATANLACAGAEPPAPCSFFQQNCHLFCPSHGFENASATWDVLAAVRNLWTYTTPTGQVVAQNVPDGSVEESLAALQITWSNTGWYVIAQTSGPNSSQSFFIDPPCQPGGTVTNLLANPTTNSMEILYYSLQFSYAASPALANGCVVVVTLTHDPGLPSTPPPSPQTAYCLYRFGVILAVNSVARHFWPSLPVADAYEQSLAQQFVTQARS